MSDASKKQRIAAAVSRLTGTLELVENADVVDLLAGFIDAGGAVRFAQRLEDGVSVEGGTTVGPLSTLERTVVARLGEFEARLQDGFDHAFRPRYRLTTASRAWATLGQFGLLDGKKKVDAAAFKKACRALWAPYNEFLETHLKRLRFALRDLRTEVVETLVKTGPTVAELATLDQAFMAATQGVIDGLYRRITPSLEAHFERRLRALLVGGLDLDAASFAAGFGPDGWLGEIMTDASALYFALLGREGRRLLDLVKSAMALDETAEER